MQLNLQSAHRYVPLLPWAAFLQVTLMTGGVFAAKPTWSLPEQRVNGYPSLSLSSDGRMLAFFGRLPGQDNDPVTLQIWDTRTKKLLLSPKHWEAYSIGFGEFLAMLPRGNGVIAGVQVDTPLEGLRTIVAITRLPVGGARVKYSLPPGRGEMGAVSLDGKMVAVTCGPGISFALHDVETGKELRVFKGDELPAPADEYTYEQKEALRLNLTKSLAFSPDGKYVAVGTRGGWVSVWNIGQGVRVWRKQPKEKDNEIQSLAFSPDSKWLASANDSLAIWRVSDGHQVNDGRILARRVFFLPGQKLLLVNPRSIHGFMVYDLTTGRLLNEDWLLPPLTRHKHGIKNWALSADGSTLAIWSTTRRIEIWNVKDLVPR